MPLWVCPPNSLKGLLPLCTKDTILPENREGGTMYIILQWVGRTLGNRLLISFAVVGLIGTLCVMQANQLVESVTTVFTTPAGIENTLGLRFVMGIVISLVVGAVIIGGIRRISVISAKIVPVMVTCYMLLVFVILCLNFDKLPGVLASIFPVCLQPGSPVSVEFWELH